MAILSLRINNFRNVSEATLSPCQKGLNIISGNNGSGKTSLLEAIHYLGLGRSFRSSSAARLIRHETDKFSLVAQLVSPNERRFPIGVEREINGTVRMRVEEKEAASIAEVAAMLPVRVIDSHSHDLFESGPSFRRKYLDWGLFYQNEYFITSWRNFERVLKQRNAILRDRRPKKELDVWSAELIKHGLELDSQRKAYVEQLSPILNEVTQELLGQFDVNMHYKSGWPEDLDYADAIHDSFQDEIRFGHTVCGPHRADLDISIDGTPVKHILSRGQQKLLICAMISAQGMLLARNANKALIYLVDDLPSELDAQSRNKLITLLMKQNTQIFITAIESETVCSVIRANTDVKMKVFHVEHGIVREE